MFQILIKLFIYSKSCNLCVLLLYLIIRMSKLSVILNKKNFLCRTFSLGVNHVENGVKFFSCGTAKYSQFSLPRERYGLLIFYIPLSATKFNISFN